MQLFDVLAKLTADVEQPPEAREIRTTPAIHSAFRKALAEMNGGELPPYYTKLCFADVPVIEDDKCPPGHIYLLKPGGAGIDLIGFAEDV